MEEESMHISIEKGGKVTIPPCQMEMLFLRDGDMVEVFARNHELIIKKKTVSCIFCNSVTALIRMGELCICRLCINRFHDAKDGDFLYPAWQT
jgi:bifunctional DNA-binding transcriptional regulator/antitoxin component of YhaV-PrlF toxin-antitoxin module